MSAQFDIEELVNLARELGGGWRIEHGAMPMIVFTLPEARGLRGRIENRHDNDQVRRLRDEGFCPTCGAEEGTGRQR